MELSNGIPTVNSGKFFNLVLSFFSYQDLAVKRTNATNGVTRESVDGGALDQTATCVSVPQVMKVITQCALLLSTVSLLYTINRTQRNYQPLDPFQQAVEILC